MGALMSALTRLDLAIRAAGVPIDGIAGAQGSVRIDFQPSATAPQIATANGIVAAFNWSAGADLTAIAQEAKAAATASIDSGQLQTGVSLERLVRSLALMVLDEFNLHTTFESALLAASASATTLADLKTRVAAITPIGQRTPAQLVTAIKAKIALTAE